AQQSGQNPQQFIQHMVEHNHIPEMVSEVVRGKALAFIVEAAKVVDESGNHVELKNLRPDGTIGDPEAEAAAAEPQFADFAAGDGEGEDEDAAATEDAPESTEESDKA
ncbi:MAG: trigger factor, partial [Actinomycetes bacterium]